MSKTEFTPIDENDFKLFAGILSEELQAKLLETGEAKSIEDAKKLSDNLLSKKLPTSLGQRDNFVSNIFNTEYQKNVGFVWIVLRSDSELEGVQNIARMAFICIFEPFRRLGLAKQAILDLEQVLIEQYHCYTLELNVFRSNEAAIKLYDQLKFEENIHKGSSSRCELVKILSKRCEEVADSSQLPELEDKADDSLGLRR